MIHTFLGRQSEIIGALIMREMATRYGRRGGGFLWLVGEPLLFCFGVILMWVFIRQRGHADIGVAPFVMSGYMCLILLRHSISFSITAVNSNVGLLYHRSIGPMHFFISRSIMELAGATAAFIVVYLTLLLFHQVHVPSDWLILYYGWVLMWVMASGTGYILSGLAMRSEVMERFVPLVSYAMIPLSGVFFMIDWLPEAVRENYLLVPFPNAVEMVRAGVFGDAVTTHFRPGYALGSALVLFFLGLLLIRNAEGYLDVE